MSHKNIADEIYSLCKTHVLEMVEKNIEDLWDKKSIKIDGKKFHSPLAYIKYEIEDRGNARYLKDSELERDYLDMKEYCKRNEIDEMQFIKSREMSKGLNK